MANYAQTSGIAAFDSQLLRVEITAGEGAIGGLAGWLNRQGFSSPLLLAGPSVGRGRFFGGLAEQLAAGGSQVTVVDTMPSPALADKVEALAAGGDGACWDAIVAVGGGSTLDAAKALSLLLARGGRVRDYAIRRASSRPSDISPPADQFVPVVVVPTTFSGSEANDSASIRDSRTGERFSLAQRAMLPRLAVLDPAALRTHRPEFLLASAFNALAHCIEGIYSRRHHPLADAVAHAAGKLLSDAIARPAEVQAAAQLVALQAGSLLAGALIREVYVGLHHAMCHALVSYCGVLHAIANATLLPWTVGYNVQRCAETAPERVAAVARCLDVSLEPAGIGAISLKLTRLQVVAGLPRRLADLGVREAQLDALVEYTLLDRALDTNPVLVDAHDLRGLFLAAL